MARIQLEGITKKYKDKIAVDNLSLDIQDNEFFVLFGPAGAGKTTTLKVIAGIEFPQTGLVKIGGEIVNLIEPMNRNVSMVFENYALYPHLSVYDNIAFPLRSKLHKKDEAYIKNAVEKVITMMNMHKVEGIYERRPSQLSNGQRQRVAIGRCLVREPNVFLMDEPLAHLDAKLRHFMRGELKEMQSAFNTTTIYVTHDFMEAMSLADRIAVMNNGKIEQLGTSMSMYYTPVNEFVARLFGEPEINIFPAELISESGAVHLHALGQAVPLVPETDAGAALLAANRNKVDVGIRGVDIAFNFERAEEGALSGTVFAFEPIGNKVIMTVDVNGCHIRVAAPNDTAAGLDQPVYITFNMKNALYFDGETQAFITRSGIEKYQ
ncbi:MAG: ABC transporter ATP-binding protein [Spirochaetaceae bacterium]|jgi:multiple sugar transport system ATP-binding protein|nr:ABC transporter ATP-binding protein [Spirochaetaceae bacterium]